MLEHKKIVDKIWSTQAQAFKTEKGPWIETNRLNIFIGPNINILLRLIQTIC